MSKLRQFINEGRGSNELENSQSLNEKLSSSDLKDVKKSTGLSPDEQNDFIIIDAISDKVDAFKKSIEKLTSKIKTPEAESKSELVTDGLQEFIWQLGDYINASIDKVNSGLNESQSGQNLVDSLSKDIAYYTGLRVTAIIDFIGGDDKFAKKLFTFAKKGNLKDRLSITKAVLKGDKKIFSKWLSESINEKLDHAASRKMEQLLNKKDVASLESSIFSIFKTLMDEGFDSMDIRNYLANQLSALKIDAELEFKKRGLNEGRFDYSNQQLLNFIESFADEQSSWGTQKLDADDVQFSAEIVTDGDKYLVDAIIKYDKGVKDKKGAAKWLADAVMSSSGNVSRQKDILARLRNSI